MSFYRCGGGKKIVLEEKSYSWTTKGDMGSYGSFGTALEFSGEVVGIASISITKNTNIYTTKYGTAAFPVKIEGNKVYVGWIAYGTLKAGTITVTAIMSK